MPPIFIVYYQTQLLLILVIKNNLQDYNFLWYIFTNISIIFL